MSAFLGPIHYWMYQKIQAQEEIIRAIAALAAEKGWATVDEMSAFVSEEDRPLDEIIEQDNIHGWLLGHIESAESRYAELITMLVKDNEDRLEQCKEILYQFGAEHAAEADASAADSYKKLEDITLNGMPCDGVNIVTDKDENHFSWEQRFDVHSDYWTKAGGNPVHYFVLRNQLMAGVLSKTAFTVAANGQGQYSLERG